MITPEPTEYRRVEHANISCRSGRHAWCSLEVDPGPAAGHLGVIEIFCPFLHTTEQGAAFYHGGPCRGCGAAV